jgi:HEPN domain-containing protein/predicted nucleotidyltransferase
MGYSLTTKIRNALQKSQRPEVVGAILFGSMVKGTATASSDVDLLVVCHGLDPKRHRRGKESAEIKQQLPAVPLDLLLLTPQEVESNFHNHNPLFLDMAAEGIVLIDAQGWLENLLAETRDYVQRRGIKKTENGWIFPVERGVPTYLSQVSNKDFSLAMLRDGERDYLISLCLIDAGYYDKAVYHCQQAVEKCVKAMLIAMGIFHKTHFVGEILRTTVSEPIVPAEWHEEIRTLADISASLEPEVNLSRYPGILQDHLWLPFDEYADQDAAQAKEQAAHVVATAKRFVEAWFSGSGKSD